MRDGLSVGVPVLVRVYVDWTSALGYASIWWVVSSDRPTRSFNERGMGPGPQGNSQNPPRVSVAGQRP